MTSVTGSAAVTRGLVLVPTVAGAACAHLDGADVEPCASQHLAARVRDARKDGRPFVGIVGDDHDLHVAAEELAHSETALLPLTALDAPVSETTRTVDLGRVNGRCFLHHARVGELPATVREILAGPRLMMRIDGRPARAWTVFVGNGCFGPGLDERSVRESIDEHVLDVRIVRGDGRGARLRRLIALLLHRAPTTREIERRTCPTIVIDVPDGDHVDVVLDGETVQLATPLRYESDANALRVLAADV